MRRWIGVFLVMPTVTGFGALDLPNDPAPAPVAVKPNVPPTPAPADELGVVFDLLDGSRIVGRIKPRNLPVVIRSDSIGEVKIPLERIRGVQFTASNQTVAVTLQNGDKLQGVILQDKFKAGTVFGPVVIGIAHLKKLEIKAAPGAAGKLMAPADWEQVPFPQDSDWGGNRGEPTEIREDELVLLGRGVRTQQTFKNGVTVECEVTLEKRATSDGSFDIQFVAADEPVDRNPRRLVSVRMIFRNPGAYSGRDGLLIGSAKGTIWGEKPFRVEPGQTYRVRVHVLSEQIQWQIDGEKYDAPGVSLPAENFRVYLKGWQPGTRWRVRNIRIE